MFCVYIIFSRKVNRYYVGTTDDFIKRLAEHNDSKHPGSFTSRGIPWESYLLIVDLHSEQAYQMEEHTDLVFAEFLPTFTQPLPFPNEKIPPYPFFFFPDANSNQCSGN